jgi:hypothetical protein
VELAWRAPRAQPNALLSTNSQDARDSDFYRVFP